MSNDNWTEAYRAGFKDGYNMGKAVGERQSTPTTISDPGPVTPDGLSYEEIYGSVIYQQNKKKET